jgi:hypothetical protein
MEMKTEIQRRARRARREEKEKRKKQKLDGDYTDLPAGRSM